ncbi:unnamed protein product [Cladocopium goreaui]|uniref:alpha-1,2-Mannosidase n=1 Tax=Cladocopium goreaui TaxID=2562237 RepID=A0A9P1CV89_9DINO|nr:unnamed protein product [Cladocopium goreaui]
MWRCLLLSAAVVAAGGSQGGCGQTWQSPAELVEIWDKQTLASFSVSQLAAFQALSCGRCPLLSRVCQRRSGSEWRKLALQYVREEAALAQRQARNMLRHVWSNYERHAFGKDQLKPVTGRGVDSWGGVAQTLVDSLDTLWMMGFHEEFHRAAEWAEANLNFDKDLNVNYFETSIRHLGGLLSAYVFSQRPGLLLKAIDLAQRLEKAFPQLASPGPGPGAAPRRAGGTASAGWAQWLSKAAQFLQQVFTESTEESGSGEYPEFSGGDDEHGQDLSQQLQLPQRPPRRARDPREPRAVGLPLSDVNLRTGKAQDLAGFLSLSETFVPVEWKFLALLTSNCDLVRHQDEVLEVLNQSADLASKGLAAILLQKNGDVHSFNVNRISLGSRGDSFYEYLLKDSLFLGSHGNPMAHAMWAAFRAKLPGLLVEVGPRSWLDARPRTTAAGRLGADSSSAPATWHRSAPALDTAGVGSGNPGEWSSITRSSLGLLAAAVLATGSRSLRGKERRRASTSCRLRRYAQGDEQGEAGLALRAPSNLYELLGVDDNADSDEIKKAYYDKMKICHPDIAGDDGEEICILLNDAYDLLSDPEEKEAYDIQLHRANGTQKPVLLLDPSPQDLSPTWDWTSKTGNKRSKPVYNGRPLSRSLHHKVAPEDQGVKWEEQKFVFVDEWTCIACRNCCDVAPRTFCIDADAGRARVFAQWGNSEELLDYAVQACPVDCIYWVSRDELQVLEYVTRDRMFETGNSLPCSMAARQGTGGGLSDPFSMASDFQAKLEEEAERRRRGGAPQGTSASVTEMQQRIQELFGKLSDRLRTAGWG